MRWLKFTFRDLFWLILLVAAVVPWNLEHRRLAKEIERYRNQSPYLTALNAQVASLSVQDENRPGNAPAALSDEELEDRLAATMRADAFPNSEFESCLEEMALRRMACTLQKQYDALSRPDAEKPIRTRRHRYQRDLLIALRRAEGRPDPLRIRLSVEPLPSHPRNEWAPRLRAEIDNVDAGEEPIWRGYERAPNQKWRFELTDDQGRQVTQAKNGRRWASYGLRRIGPLEFQETDAYSVDLRQHFAPPRSGRYQLQAFYREAGLPRGADMSGLFISKSDPVSVVVHNPNERGSKPSAADIRAGFAGVVACGMLAFFGLSFRARVRNWMRYFTIRDALWFVMVLAVLALAWFDHARQVDKLWEVFPDSEAQWSIEMAASAD